MWENLIAMFLTKDMVARLSRTALQAGGSALVTHGVMTGSDVEAIVGGLVGVITTVYTAIASKKKVEQVAELKAVIADAVPANNVYGGLR